MSANYDPVASFYDLANRLIFGRAPMRAQSWLVSFVPARSSILIAGGGTGWILELLGMHQREGLKIDYVESSGKMLHRAIQRNGYENQINYIYQPIERFSKEKKYDVIITPFLLDNFSDEELSGMFVHLQDLLKPEGYWLFADFHKSQSSPWWQKSLLRVMYIFFRSFCRISASALPDFKKYFLQHQFKLCASKFLYSNFILAAVYSRNCHTLSDPALNAV
jgi:ubiquinone/menaquinone biosynthesis C-methylase UbiE